jgi:hypothetical protein
MALPTSYLTTAKNLGSILTAVQGAQAPDKFTYSFLESLEFKSSSDRLVIGVLKSLGLIDEGGRPTERYFRFLDQTQSARVLAEGIKEAYQDLFKINIKAFELTKQEVVNKFKTLGAGKISESVLDKMGMTFTALVKLADFESPPAVEQKDAAKDESTGAHRSSESSSGNLAALKIGGLVYNIQIVLPESRDPAVYDALFTSLKKHLV